jgi:outer membrane lipoprotein-sorting protein
MSKRWFGLSVLVVLSLLLSGCQSGPTAEEIVAKMQEVEASTEDAHAVVEFSLQVEEVDLEVVVELWEKRPSKFKAEVLEAGDAEFAGIVSITDGQQGWLYHPGENVVVTGALGEIESEEIPIDPQRVIQMMEEGIQWAMDNFDVRLLGEEDLNGAATYKLEFTPKEGDESPMPIPIEGKATLWVEKDRWIALQAHFDGGSLGEGWVRVRSFEFNTGLDDELFQFVIPEHAHVIHIEDMQPTPLTLEEAREQASFDLLVPAYVPDGATLIEVFSVGEAIILRYDHSTTSFTIVQGDLPHLEHDLQQREAHGDAVEVTVRGQTAMLVIDDAGNSLLTWEENGVSVTVAGHIGEDEVLRVAESLQ